MPPITDLPLEMLALITDHLHDFNDIGNMMLVCRRLYHGVRLSRQWMVVEEIVAAWTLGPDRVGEGPAGLRRLMHNRRMCAKFACKHGLLRTLRSLHLSRDEVTQDRCDIVLACAYGQLECLKHLHETYHITSEDIDHVKCHEICLRAIQCGSVEVLRYLHTTLGIPKPSAWSMAFACQVGNLDVVAYLHAGFGVTAEDTRSAVCSPLYWAVNGGHTEVVAYLHNEFGMTLDDARAEITHLGSEWREEMLEIVRAEFNMTD